MRSEVRRGVGREAAGWLGLRMTAGLRPSAALRLAEEFGGPDKVLTADPGRLAAAGLAPDLITALAAAARAATNETVVLQAAGAELVTWGDDAYPSLLRHIHEPPLALAVRGRLAPEDAIAVAVVGTRRPSEYGLRLAAAIAGGLATGGVTVVSGLAAGIDAAAHRAALAAGGRTIAVLGTGIDRIYPTWHTGLAGQVVARGALVSELPCGAPPLSFHFPQRNRLISGLSLGTVVVEAAARSGSLITARFALEQGREVFAVPGPVGGSLQSGPHRLIQQGAKLVTTVDDVLAEVAPALQARLAAARRARLVADLNPTERQVLAAVDDLGRHVDEVIQIAGLSAAATLETLLVLELRGLVAQRPGKRFARQAA